MAQGDTKARISAVDYVLDAVLKRHRFDLSVCSESVTRRADSRGPVCDLQVNQHMISGCQCLVTNVYSCSSSASGSVSNVSGPTGVRSQVYRRYSNGVVSLKGRF